MSDYDALFAALKQKTPNVKEFFAGWPAAVPSVPGDVYTDIDLYPIGGFEDPRLALYTGVSRLPSLTVGWCLFAAARNIRSGTARLSTAARQTLADAAVVRALQFLAVDTPETNEAAIEALAVPGVAQALVTLASAAHQENEGRTEPIACEVGTAVYACHRGPVRMGARTVDVVLVGSPIWIAKHDTEQTPRPASTADRTSPGDDETPVPGKGARHEHES